MRLYVASSFSRADTVRTIAAGLEKAGHTIPDVWWNVNEDREAGCASDAEWHGRPEIRALAARHWTTIKEADALVVVGNLSESNDRQRFTGANVELGYALALGKPVVVVGRVKRSAMYSDCIFAESPGAMLRLLAILDREAR